MTSKQVEEKLTELKHRKPFIPFVVELNDGRSLIVPEPPVFDENGAGFFDVDGALADFWFKDVRAIRLFTSADYDVKMSANGRFTVMTIKQIEEKVIELKHRKPFLPFVFEMTDGQLIEVVESCLSIDETGAGFFARDGGLADVEFKNVRAIRILDSEAVA